MLLHDVWDYLVIGLCLAGLAVAYLALRADPGSTLNRSLAAYSVLLAAAEVCQMVATNVHPIFGLRLFRAGHSLSCWSIFAVGVMCDAVDHPVSAFQSRIGRMPIFFALAAAVALLPCTPFWHPRELGVMAEGINFHEIVFKCYLILRLLLVAWLLAVCIRAYLRSSPQRRFDNQAVLLLTASALAGCILLLQVRIFHLHQAVHWTQLILPGFFPIQLWMMTGRQTESFRRLGVAAAGLSLGIALAVLLILPLLSFAGRTTSIWMGLAVVMAAYPALLGVELVTRQFVGDYESRTKARLTELIASAVCEEELSGGFCRLVEAFAGTCVADLEFCEGAQLGSHLASRPLSVSVVSRRGERSAILHVTRLSTLKIITRSSVRCMRELLATVQVARERLLLAGKAIHNDRLASVGFIASQISHQARNRLDPIRSALELLMEGRESELTAEHRELLLEEMESFLVDFNVSLDMARADLGRGAACQVGDIVAEALDIFRIYAARRGITIETAFDPFIAPIWVDRQLIRQTLFNLLRNAAEALEGVAEPKITIACRVKVDRVEIDIWDSGPGVPVEVHDRLFTDFATTKKNGTGIGLSLCRSAMALMNGSVAYLTPKGQRNAHFRVTVPAGGPIAPAV